MHSCKHEAEELEANTKFPPQIEAIVSTKCAVSGCHNEKSKAAAAGLSLETWNALFKGGNGGSVVIPYNTENSTFMYYVNHDSLLNMIELLPTMPVGNAPLSLSELQIFYDWITNGAPDNTGVVDYSNHDSHKKIYVANRGSDLVTIIDSKSILAKRVIEVGINTYIDQPTMIKVSNDNRYWYVCYLSSSVLSKYSVSDNSLVGQATIGALEWMGLLISDDDETAYVFEVNTGKMAVVNLSTMTSQIYNGFGNPTGSAFNKTNDTIYLTNIYGNNLLKFAVGNPSVKDTIDLIGNYPTSGDVLQPYSIVLSLDGTKLFVACQELNEVRVLQLSNDSIIKVLPVGLLPQQMAISLTHPYLFVACTDALNPDPSKRGEIAIINYQTNTLIKKVYSGYQPYGLIVDDVNGKVYVSNRNNEPTGPAPHHAPPSPLCAGRNGYISVIDLNTLELIPGSNTEASVDPFGMGISN